jgi:phosphomannomutase
MKSGIFGAYDVRGIYPETINEDIISKIGLVAKKLLLGNKKRGSFVIGHDARLSSNSLYRALIRSVRKASPKSRLYLTGLITTPEMSFLVNHLKSDGGIMVTASHNPKQYNGVKLVKEKSIPVSGKEIYAVYKKLR